MKRALLFTCEHGGARVPPNYRPLFAGPASKRKLQSHRGSDIGALSLARSLALSFDAPLYASTVTRLLVDLNRSIGHPRLFSEISRDLRPAERKELLDEHYFPHRNRVEVWIEAKTRRGDQVLHIGVHSFTPQIDGRERNADVGLLYDPARSAEKTLCARWKAGFREVDPALRVRRNYPYLGKADGFVPHLRRTFPARQYVGMELEVNQALLATPRGRRRAADSIRESLRLAL